MKAFSKTTVRLLNLAFVVVAAAILIFLWKAPKITTARLPKDETHLKFYKIKSEMEAEKFCLNCHSQKGVAPLAKDHPPKYRCLLCHRRK